MKLRLKTPLVLASLVLLVLTASIWSAVKTHRDAQVHSSRSRTQERAAFAVNALRLTIADFHARWAGWAMLPESDAEARVPIQVASLQGVAPRLGVHLLVVEDRQGRMIWGSGIQPGSPRPTPVPRAVRQWLTSDPMTMTRARGRRSVSGLLVVGGTPLIVSAHLLRTPGKRGAVRGRLVVGRWLDERELNRIREVADAPLELFALGAEDFPDDVQRSLASLRQLEVPHVAVEPGEPSRGYVLLGDVTDRRALVLRVTPEAAAYPGQPDLGVRIAGLVGVVLGLGLLMAFWLDRSVFQRLEKLASALQDAGQPGRSAPPAAIRGHDELGEAARALERLVQRNGAEQDWWEQRETALQAALKKASDQGRRTASLLAEMARELRGPVNAIVGASEGLDAAEPGVLSAAQKRWITEVLVNSRRLLQLANDSADLSASSAASVPAALRPAEIVHETVGAVAALAERMGVAITLDVSQAPPECWAEPRAFRTLCQAMLLQGLFYTPAGDTLNVSLAESLEEGAVDNFEEEEAGSAWIVLYLQRLSSDGPRPLGTPLQEALGEAAAAPSLTRLEDSIGFALTRAIAEQHGGTACLDGGIHVVLPLQARAPATARSSPFPWPEVEGGTVLTPAEAEGGEFSLEESDDGELQDADGFAGSGGPRRRRPRQGRDPITRGLRAGDSRAEPLPAVSG